MKKKTIVVSRFPDVSGDFICDGINDEVEIQAAIDSLKYDIPRFHKFLLDHLNFFGIFNFLKPKVIYKKGIYNLKRPINIK